MDWKDHLKGFEKMRNSTREPQREPRSSSVSQRYAKGGFISPYQKKLETLHKIREGTDSQPTMREKQHDVRKNNAHQIVPKGNLQRMQEGTKNLIEAKKIGSSKTTRKPKDKKDVKLNESDSSSSISPEKTRRKIEEKNPHEFEIRPNSPSNYLAEEFRGKHIRKFDKNRSDSANEKYLKEQAEDKARQRFGTKDIPRSTMIGMNSPVRNSLRDFIKRPDTQRKLQNEEKATFEIPYDKGSKALAYSTGQSGTEEHRGREGFKSFSFQSLPKDKKNIPEYTSPKGTKYRIPNHFNRTNPEKGKSL